jgi:hypothetical protein
MKTEELGNKTKDYYMSLSPEERHKIFIVLFKDAKKQFRLNKVNIEPEEIIADITKMFGTYEDYMAMIGWLFMKDINELY